MLARNATTAAPSSQRVPWIDNLRTCMVFLVVVIHAAGVYETSGRWSFFWIVDDPATTSLSDLLIILLDLFLMPTMFFVSGCVAPGSLAFRSAFGFLKAKARRLMLPWAIAVLTLIPLYKFIFLYSRNIPQEHWTTYFHWNVFWGQNWLWFLPVLFCFNVVYVVAAKAHSIFRAVPIRFTAAAFFMVGWAYSCMMDVFNLEGWTHTIVLDFQNERLLVYLTAFLFGAICAGRRILDAPSTGKALPAFAALAACGTATLYVFLRDRFHDALNTAQPFDILITLTLWLSYHAALFAAVYATVRLFRAYLNGSSRLSKLLSDHSYYVYIVHSVVLGVIATGLLRATLPAVVKLCVLSVGTYTGSVCVAAAIRKLTGINLRRSKTEDRIMKAVTSALVAFACVAVSGCEKEERVAVAAQPPHVAIHMAALQGHVDAIQQHIDAGSDLNAKDDYGSTPLIIAATFGKTEVARALVKAGAGLEVRNNDGGTALHVAAFLCRTEIVQILLDGGADANAKNAAGRTPLDSVAGPFDNAKPVYDHLAKGLKPLGLRLDYEHIKKSRPEIARMLHEA